MSTITPPLDPFLIPDTPTQQVPDANPKTGPIAIPKVATLPTPASKKTRRNRVPKKSEPQKFTIEDAFEYTQSPGRNTGDLEKAIRSISFLLKWATDIGNEDPPGILVNGLAFGLDSIADGVKELFVWDDILKLGGDPRTIRNPSSTENPQL